MTELLTIKESAALVGRSETILYRLVKQKRLKVQNTTEQFSGKFKTVKRIEKGELIRFFRLKEVEGSKQFRTESSEPDRTVQNSSEPKENLKEILEQFFQEKETQLMKPIESQALYRLGKIEQENTFLKQQIETVRTENELLREEVKKLPDHATLNTFEQVQKDLTERNKAIEKEKEWLRSQLEKSQALNTELQEKLNRKWWKFWK